MLLCGLSISNKTPDMIILDEPTNNLDLQNVEILTSSIKDYHGTLVVISHDGVFLEEIGVVKEVFLAKKTVSVIEIVFSYYSFVGL
ncbi:hypothetical protein [Chryseobacterium indoltheticum]|uniref:hypothetical protein n=1 Tax=Chryseobacterium indoltheticum TaxID=254 RepID=UPI003F4913DB